MYGVFGILAWTFVGKWYVSVSAFAIGSLLAKAVPYKVRWTRSSRAVAYKILKWEKCFNPFLGNVEIEHRRNTAMNYVYREAYNTLIIHFCKNVWYEQRQWHCRSWIAFFFVFVNSPFYQYIFIEQDV